MHETAALLAAFLASYCAVLDPGGTSWINGAIATIVGQDLLDAIKAYCGFGGCRVAPAW